MSSALERRIEEALKDEHLHNAVRKAVDHLRGQKQSSEDQIAYEDFRVRAKSIRTHTVTHLDFYLKQFANNVRDNGGTVHFCHAREDVIRTLLRIIPNPSGQTVVKSKSMVTEELGINEALEAAGCEVVETDLGEYINQLNGDSPAHIVSPSLHQTKEQVRDKFEEVFQESVSASPTELTALARRVLRTKFLEADVGITGCNFGIAETGSITLFTNEGNARMVTSLPSVHICVMGMERILPTLADLDVFMNLLPRAATGQKLTSYVSLVSGPKGEHELDGAREFHVIVVDNGRSEILGTEYQEVLNCIRCGACLNACPTFRHTGGHAYGSVYSGPIGIVLTPLLEPTSEEVMNLPYDCSVCGACAEACPVQIPLPDMIVRLRARNVQRKHTSQAERWAFRAYGKRFAQPRRYRSTMRLARALLNLTAKDGYTNLRAPGLAGWTSVRDFPAMPSLTFHERVEKGLVSQLRKGGDTR